MSNRPRLGRACRRPQPLVEDRRAGRVCRHGARRSTCVKGVEARRHVDGGTATCNVEDVEGGVSDGWRRRGSDGNAPAS
jgi:hypothetical protein